ncbi:hypothetical protein BU16DRAFT_560639 [Lophium mytilinum]|uniref:Uncharacterized protein n=1 Tax=Lophium mytilinum TaxID=390894 RepID=A0A6A6QTQ4_9PEZI|nr:hypothetical protein BU16DRAFT_560639 [Lophium mytilinum]
MGYLNDLPDELKLLIVEAIQNSAKTEKQGRQTLLNLSGTCSRTRSFLAPILFDRVTVRNGSKFAASVIALANSQFGQYVKNLRFERSLDPNNYTRGGEDYFDRDPIFPTPVNFILSNLHKHFPNLDTLEIRFEILITDNSRENQAFREDRIDGLRLMERVYEALCKNKHHRLKTLRLLGVPPVDLAIFSSKEFHDFLKHIKSFYIGLGMDPSSLSSGPELSTYLAMYSWSDENFCSKLPSLFLNHIPSATQLRISTSQARRFVFRRFHWNSHAQSHERNVLPPWDVVHLPKLKSVHFDGIIICKKLLDFLNAHKDRLERIAFGDCMAVDDIKEGWIETWGDIFKVLASAEASPLRDLQISSMESSVARIPRTPPDHYDTYVETAGSPGGLRGFAYSGGRREHHGLKSHSAIYAGDLQWHSALRDIIKRNKIRAK